MADLIGIQNKNLNLRIPILINYSILRVPKKLSVSLLNQILEKRQGQFSSTYIYVLIYLASLLRHWFVCQNGRADQSNFFVILMPS